LIFDGISYGRFARLNPYTVTERGSDGFDRHIRENGQTGQGSPPQIFRRRRHILLHAWNDGELWLCLLAEVFVARQTCRRYREIRVDLMFFNKPIRIMRKLPGKLDTNKDAK
jgi:hypothetical protein